MGATNGLNQAMRIQGRGNCFECNKNGWYDMGLNIGQQKSDGTSQNGISDCKQAWWYILSSELGLFWIVLDSSTIWIHLEVPITWPRTHEVQGTTDPFDLDPCLAGDPCWQADASRRRWRAQGDVAGFPKRRWVDGRPQSVFSGTGKRWHVDDRLITCAMCKLCFGMFYYLLVVYNLHLILPSMWNIYTILLLVAQGKHSNVFWEHRIKRVRSWT